MCCGWALKRHVEDWLAQRARRYSQDHQEQVCDAPKKTNRQAIAKTTSGDLASTVDTLRLRSL